MAAGRPTTEEHHPWVSNTTIAPTIEAKTPQYPEISDYELDDLIGRSTAAC
jgi:hypothetical protein